MSPTDPQLDPEAMLHLIGSLRAVTLAMRKLEGKASPMIWKCHPKDRGKLTECVMEAMKAFSHALDACKVTPKPGVGPNCRPGFHEEFDICVPDN